MDEATGAISTESKEVVHDATPEVVTLDPDGDVTLVIDEEAQTSQKKFVVSSKALGLASPVFSRMFSADFKEGNQIRQGNCPHIILKEDNAKAMETVFRIIHFQYTHDSSSMDPETLAVLAIHCDKYNCDRAMRPWIMQWCRSPWDASNPKDIGFMLLATYMFRSPAFNDIATEAVRKLAPDFVSAWEEYETLELLPTSVTDALSERISKTLDKIHRLLQSVPGKLREYKKGYTMTGFVCMNCGRVHSDSVGRCHPCNNEDLFVRYCTSEFRVSEYLALLEHCGLWPSVEPLTECSISDIAFRVRSTQENAQRHRCGARKADLCPLKRELDVVAEQVERILREVKGISIEEAAGDSDPE